MAERADYYAVLGVGRDASAVVVRAAYRRLVLSHHPDRHPDDPAATTRLKHLVEAYETLGDESSRRAYDQGAFQPPPVESVARWEEVLGRVVDALVGARDSRPVNGRNHQYNLSITLREAGRGCAKPLSLPWPVTCEGCGGRGFPLEVFPTVCEACQGAGCIEERRVLRKVLDTCEPCQGRGFLVSTPCSVCSGSRTHEVRKKVTIEVPAGVESGAKLVVRGAGEPGAWGGADGDCFVLVTVEPDPTLAVMGRDVTMVRPVTVLQALTGAWVVVPTLDGSRRLRLPPNTLDGAVLRMPSLGVGGEGAERGDQLVTVAVEYPVALGPDVRQELEALSTRLGTEAFPATGRFEQGLAPIPSEGGTVETDECE